MSSDRSGTEQGAPDKGFERTGQGGTGGESHGEDLGMVIAPSEDDLEDDFEDDADPAGRDATHQDREREARSEGAG